MYASLKFKRRIVDPKLNPYLETNDRDPRASENLAKRTVATRGIHWVPDINSLVIFRLPACLYPSLLPSSRIYSPYVWEHFKHLVISRLTSEPGVDFQEIAQEIAPTWPAQHVAFDVTSGGWLMLSSLVSINSVTFLLLSDFMNKISSHKRRVCAIISVSKF